MKNKKHLLGFIVAIVLTLVSWAIAIYFWGKLPAQIPTHFNFSGQADAWNNKSLFYVFLIPFIQTVMLGLFGFLYWKPQYSDMPTTLWLETLPKDRKEHAFDLIRTMLVVVALWIGLLFSYMTYMMNASALQKVTGPSPWIMIGLIVGLLVFMVYWTVKVYKATKKVINK